MNKLFLRLQTPDDDKGGGGGGGDDKGAPPAPWFGDANKEFVANKGWKSGDDAIGSVKSLETLLGADRAGRTVVLPKDDKDVEGIKAYNSKIGVPESADKYELPVPDGDSGEFAKQAASWLHAAGVPKAAGQKLAGQWNEFVKKSIADGQAAIKTEMDKQLGDLKGEWGEKFDANAEVARRFMTASGWSEAKVKLYEETFGTADMLKTFNGLGAKMGEHSFVKGADSGGGALNPAQAKEKLDELRAKRVDGKISERDYLEAAERLSAIAAKAA